LGLGERTDKQIHPEPLTEDLGMQDGLAWDHEAALLKGRPDNGPPGIQERSQAIVLARGKVNNREEYDHAYGNERE
jgi:hypothetical protein